MSRRKGLLAAAGMVAVIAVAAGATALWMGFALRAQVQSTTKIGGPFTLVDDTGAQVTDAALKGRPTVMYFGFTFCPEICPATLTELTQWMQQLGPDADKLNYVFVTVDPERDTPKVMMITCPPSTPASAALPELQIRSQRSRANTAFTTNGFRPRTVAIRWIIPPAFILWTRRSDFLDLSPIKRRLMWRLPS
jgi:hypothetical protein